MFFRGKLSIFPEASLRIVINEALGWAHFGGIVRVLWTKSKSESWWPYRCLRPCPGSQLPLEKSSPFVGLSPHLLAHTSPCLPSFLENALYVFTTAPSEGQVVKVLCFVPLSLTPSVSWAAAGQPPVLRAASFAWFCSFFSTLLS